MKGRCKPFGNQLASLVGQLIQVIVALLLGFAHGLLAVLFEQVRVDLPHLGGLEYRRQVLHGPGNAAPAMAGGHGHIGEGAGGCVVLAKITESVTVFTEITLCDHKREDFATFESNIHLVDEVLECHLISGGYDYLVRFMTRSIQHYQDMMEVLLDKNIGISKYFSYIVIKSPVHKDGVPLRKLLSQQ